MAEPVENRPLTALRGVAAVWVVFSHLTVAFQDHWHGWSWNVLRAGYMGVDVFFVLSGFILGIVYARLAPAGVPRFMLKRLLRVYPLNVVSLLIYAILAATVMPIGTWADWHLLPWCLLMLQAYLPAVAYAWNPATWSVGIELACYLCFPPAVMLLRRLPTPALAAAAALLLIGLWWAQGWCLGWPWGWRALARGMADFWPGMALGLLAPRLRRCPRALASAAELVAVAALLAATATQHLRYVPLASALLVLGLYFDAGPVSRVLRTAPLYWLGEVSFSIYLLHALLIGRMLPLAYAWARVMPWPAAIPLFIACFLAAVVALSLVTYATIEQPGRRLARLWRGPDTKPLPAIAA